jgi:hypothetical protein
MRKAKKRSYKLRKLGRVFYIDPQHRGAYSGLGNQMFYKQSFQFKG